MKPKIEIKTELVSYFIRTIVWCVSFLHEDASGILEQSNLRHHHRKLQTVQMIVLPFIPIVALITQNIVGLKSVLEYQTDVQELNAQVSVAGDVAKLISHLQWERSELAFFIFLNGTTIRYLILGNFNLILLIMHCGEIEIKYKRIM